MNGDNKGRRVNVSGTGQLAGGEYESVTIAGSGVVDGDLQAKNIVVTGSGRFMGSVSAEEIRTTGSCRVAGSLDVNQLVIWGSMEAGGELRADLLKTYGSLTAEQDVHSDKAFLAGSCSVGGDLQAEEFISRGTFDVSGLLTADLVKVWLVGTNSAGEIGGREVIISARGLGFDIDKDKVKSGVENVDGALSNLGKSLGFDLELDSEKISREVSKLGGKFGSFVSSWGKRKLTTKLIEGDELKLGGVSAETVRGDRVEIGEGCKIGLVEYRDSFSCAESSEVSEQGRL
ncbi:polymer-forming cytoskeletal protein [Candidatus Bipolaricaulota bacterium]|nr:polymer-forming cytoskeletal protein [Candidatus Bipolaricaulota bacterium]